MRMDLGETIKMRRKECGLTLEQLSDKACIHIHTLTNLEANKSNPRLDTLLSVLDVLGMEIIFYMEKKK